METIVKCIHYEVCKNKGIREDATEYNYTCDECKKKGMIHCFRCGASFPCRNRGDYNILCNKCKEKEA